MMKAMVLTKISHFRENPAPLTLMELPLPAPGEFDLLLKVSACGVCHTELDQIEGRIPPPRLPVVPGHQVIGRVEALGQGVKMFGKNDRVGVAWYYSACGKCKHCLVGRENLCEKFSATGCDANGGYAQYMAVPESAAYPIPDVLSDEQAAPLLCAGAIGYRSLRLCGLTDGQRLGLTGFGASAHLVLKMAGYLYPNSEVYVFARSPEQRQFALELGAVWAEDTTVSAPHKLDCIIDTTPVWAPAIFALANLDAGGRLVINAIRKQGDERNLLNLHYPTHLWREKEVKSVANITRRDVSEFLQLAANSGIYPKVETFSLEQANEALLELQAGSFSGAKVLKIAET